MTGFLVDTNVISETARREAEPRVTAWLSERESDGLFIASLTLGELVRGALQIRDLALGRQYGDWIHGYVIPQFGGRILPFDQPAALVWGEMMAAGQRRGRPIPPLDAQIAAIAKCRDLTVVTRNVRDFRETGIPIVNPWGE